MTETPVQQERRACKVKVQCGESIRKYKLREDDMVAELKRRLGSENIQLYYIDEDGDEVDIGSNDDIFDAQSLKTNIVVTSGFVPPAKTTGPEQVDEPLPPIPVDEHTDVKEEVKEAEEEAIEEAPVIEEATSDDEKTQDEDLDVAILDTDGDDIVKELLEVIQQPCSECGERFTLVFSCATCTDANNGNVRYCCEAHKIRSHEMRDHTPVWRKTCLNLDLVQIKEASMHVQKAIALQLKMIDHTVVGAVATGVAQGANAAVQHGLAQQAVSSIQKAAEDKLPEAVSAAMSATKKAWQSNLTEMVKRSWETRTSLWQFIADNTGNLKEAVYQTDLAAQQAAAATKVVEESKKVTELAVQKSNSAFASSTLKWSMGIQALMTAGEMSYHFYNYKKGLIDRETLGWLVADTAVRNVAGFVGSSAGTAAGMWASSYFMAGAGVAVGGFLGAVIGGMITCALAKQGFQYFKQRWTKDVEEEADFDAELVQEALKLFRLQKEDLENPEKFNEEWLTSAYKELAKLYHPDRTGPYANVQNFQTLLASYGILKGILAKQGGSTSHIRRTVAKAVLAIGYQNIGEQMLKNATGDVENEEKEMEVETKAIEMSFSIPEVKTDSGKVLYQVAESQNDVFLWKEFDEFIALDRSLRDYFELDEVVINQLPACPTSSYSDWLSSHASIQQRRREALEVYLQSLADISDVVKCEVFHAFLEREINRDTELELD